MATASYLEESSSSSSLHPLVSKAMGPAIAKTDVTRVQPVSQGNSNLVVRRKVRLLRQRSDRTVVSPERIAQNRFDSFYRVPRILRACDGGIQEVGFVTPS